MISRAKTLDGEMVKGYLKNCTDTGLDVFWIQTKDFIDYIIDPSTLQHKVGSEWYSEDRLLDLVVKGLKVEYKARKLIEEEELKNILVND